MIQLSLIGIGTGNPDHMTRQGAEALRSADMVLLPLKGTDKADLSDLRNAIIARETAESRPTIVEFEMPVRDQQTADYTDRVSDWHDDIANRWAEAIAGTVGASGKVAVLIWGDPSLYDSSLRLTERLKDKLEIHVSVIPGITAIQALCAAHKITLNEIGEPVLITTGRKLRELGWPDGTDTLVVMLDGHCSFQHLQGGHIWWGAYLGMPQEVLLAGALDDVGAEIVKTRARARDRQGWIMDTYILRRQSE